MFSHFWSHEESLIGSLLLKLYSDMFVCAGACASVLSINLLFTFLHLGRL